MPCSHNATDHFSCHFSCHFNGSCPFGCPWSRSEAGLGMLVGRPCTVGWLQPSNQACAWSTCLQVYSCQLHTHQGCGEGVAGPADAGQFAVL
jgi:hypothetical protein